MKKVFTQSFLGILLAALPCIVHAQTTASTLTGVVKDASGAVVPGAKVQVANEASGVAVSAAANEAGLYRVIGLIPGSYRVEVEAPGFQKMVHPGITVQISQTSETDDFRPWIRLWAPNGAVLGNVSGLDAATINSVLAPVSGTYLILVASFDSGFDGTGTYNLTVTIP